MNCLRLDLLYEYLEGALEEIAQVGQQGRWGFTSGRRGASRAPRASPPAAGARDLLVGSDDGMTVWMNGTRAFDKQVCRACVADSDSFRVTLKRGGAAVGCGPPPVFFGLNLGALRNSHAS